MTRRKHWTCSKLPQCHRGLRFMSYNTAVAPRFRCDGGSTAEARQNTLKVSAVQPRRSVVLTLFRGATAINDGTTAEPRRSWRCHCGLCRTNTAVAPGLRCDGGISDINSYNNVIAVITEATSSAGAKTVIRPKTTSNYIAAARTSWSRPATSAPLQ